MDELTIITEQQQSCSVLVETPNRLDSLKRIFVWALP